MSFTLSLGRFYGIDSLIEVLIILVAIVISLYSHKIYKIIKEQNYKYFSWAFLFIAVSFTFKILSNLTIYQRIRIERINFVYTVFSQPNYMQILNFISFILYNIFYLLGFLILFLILTKTDKKEKIFLYMYLSIIAILFSIYFNFIFHLTLILILVFLTMHFYENYKNHRTTNSILVYIAFLLMLISHIFMVFSDVHSLIYMISEGLMLIGFLFLLTNQIKLKKFTYNYGKKKQARSNKRYLRNTAKK